MSGIFRSFYGRLSSVFLILILALGAGSIVIAFDASGRLFDEVEQLLNREYAASIASELAPLIGEEFTEDRIKSAIHYMMVLNPMVEIYLVDGGGSIVAYFTHPEETIERSVVDIEPLLAFIRDDGQELILGDDPRTAGRRKPFSAAPLRMGNDEGFVYVILRGQSYDRSLEALRNSYYLRTGLVTFLLAVVITLLLGLSLFYLITRRLRILSQAVKAFRLGDLDRRVEVRGTDELGLLGRTFNEMASTIEAGVENLRLAEEQRKELIANISHDLRSPLTSIRGHLETVLLQDARLDPEKRREFLETILRSVSSFQRLVEELFDLVRLETRQIRPSREPFQLAELAQDVVLKMRAKAEGSGITLAAEHPEALPLVDADIGLVERVLTNLIENALRYTPRGGHVRLTLGMKGHDVTVTVSDTGPGIAPADLPHVFERFYRADKSRDRTVSGTGLGLAIAKEIVELHGGQIDAENIPGSGAAFRFDLPITG